MFWQRRADAFDDDRVTMGVADGAVGARRVAGGGTPIAADRRCTTVRPTTGWLRGGLRAGAAGLRYFGRGGPLEAAAGGCEVDRRAGAAGFGRGGPLEAAAGWVSGLALPVSGMSR
ncbi:hypothetical protein Airi02_103030 [Actinoallomurus iriomotensis]|uniref:Uncharacterized protein n=1 Tax=Actinoallomurus iriomotensis TaxID=478107 RepID=A0A9W6W5T1_9ACTN|nr:hypothetical protein Airi02_103030 [Actinoallomurus iriomotensis]